MEAGFGFGKIGKKTLDSGNDQRERERERRLWLFGRRGGGRGWVLLREEKKTKIAALVF